MKQWVYRNSTYAPRQIYLDCEEKILNILLTNIYCTKMGRIRNKLKKHTMAAIFQYKMVSVRLVDLDFLYNH